MIFCYNDDAIAFLKIVQKKVLTTLCAMGFTVKRSRLHFQNMSYPIKIITFEHTTTLGFFSPNFYEIGINRALEGHIELDSVIKHECVHFIAYLLHGDAGLDHGVLFRETAKNYGFDKTVYLSKIALISKNSKENPILRKIKKLLELSNSANSHEANAAALKANQLLISHNLDKSSLSPTSDSDLFMERVLTVSRGIKKLEAISQILRTFLLVPILNQGKNTLYLEIYGTHENVLIGEYIASFLSEEMERLYKKAKIENPELKGIKHKYSFFQGVAKGYLSLHKQGTKQKENIIQAEKLLPIYQELEAKVDHLHGRSLKSTKISKSDQNSIELGKKAGKNLQIHKAMKKSMQDPLMLELL